MAQQSSSSRQPRRSRRFFDKLSGMVPSAMARSEYVEAVRQATSIVEEALGPAGMSDPNEAYRGVAMKVVLEELLNFEVDEDE